MKKILELISNGDRLSSKRTLAFVFSIVLIITVFTGFGAEIIYALMGFITALLGITGVEKFRKNYEKN